MQVVLTRIIPSNVEAAFTAFITGTFVFSYEVGCKMSGSLFCQWFHVDNANLNRYWIVLAAKIPCILLTMLFVQIIPSNDDVLQLAKRQAREKQIKQME